MYLDAARTPILLPIFDPGTRRLKTDQASTDLPRNVDLLSWLSTYATHIPLIHTNKTAQPTQGLVRSLLPDPSSYLPTSNHRVTSGKYLEALQALKVWPSLL